MNKVDKFVSFLGVIIIALGVMVYFKWNPYRVWHFQYMLRGWWTLIIIIPSVICILKNEPSIFNVGACLIGIVLFLTSRYLISFYWIKQYVLPAVLILLGAVIIFGVRTKK